MSEHFESALFVYSEAGKIYRDSLVENSHGSSISPVSIEELRDNTSVLLKDTNHVVIAAELLIIKEVMLLSMKYGFSLGFLPLKEQKALKCCYIIPEDEAEMISLALKNDPSKESLIYLLLALMFQQTGHLERAEVWFKKVLELEPHALVFNELANVCQ